ncbi:MAG: hypothetical protein HOY78_21955 [Saccharothrix sp.]|nr:hypothetical protein [Saccharothrix sp.]
MFDDDRLTADETRSAANAGLIAAVARAVDTEAALARVKQAALRRGTATLEDLDVAAAPPIIGL